MINKYPYTDFHELNLDWILREIMKLHHDYDEFKAVNTITNAGAWDITKQYAAWTVVSDNNIGYISLQPVPAGVPITNIQYWGVIADYNILITDLSNRISVLEAALPVVNDKADMLITERQKIDNIIIVGDSYAALSTNWYYPFVSLTGATNIYNASVSGASFAATFGGTHFIDNLAAITVSDPDKIEHILIAAGINDCVSPVSLTDIATAIDDMASYISTTYKNAMVHLAFIGNQSLNSTDPYQRTGTDIRNVIREYIKGANRNSWHYITNSEYIMKNPTFFIADGLHPNSTACDYIAQFMVEGILTGSCDVHYEINVMGFTGTLDPGITQVDANPLINLIYIDNDTASIILPPHEFNFTGNSQTNSITKLFKILTFDGVCPVTTCDVHLAASTTVTAMSQITDGSIYYKEYPLQFEICNGELNLLTQPPLNQNGSAWGTGAIDNVSMAWSSITLNTLYL